MTDRQMLELAAKAAGYDVRWHETWECFVHAGPFNITNPPTAAGQRQVWVPLDDDGDALRLAVQLGLFVECDGDFVVALHRLTGAHAAVLKDTGPRAATRRAIVTTAAEVQRVLE